MWRCTTSAVWRFALPFPFGEGPSVTPPPTLTVMTLIDVAIGLLLMNAMPHFVLGMWRQRMLSGLGMSPRANIGYGLLNFTGSAALFLYAYGLDGLTKHGMFVGALFILLTYFATSHVWRRRFSGIGV